MQLCGGMSPSPAHLSTCRPVSCSTSQALPLEPGFVNSTIYQDQLGSGWGVGGSAVKWLQHASSFLLAKVTSVHLGLTFPIALHRLTAHQMTFGVSC